MKKTIIQHCLEILKREDIKSELQTICSPLIQLIFNIVNPYIYITLFLVFLIFVIIFINLMLLIYLFQKKYMSGTEAS